MNPYSDLTMPPFGLIVSLPRMNHKDLRSRPDIRTRWLSAIFETSVDALITINERGIIQEANPALEHLLGYPPSDIRGSNVSVLMDSDHAPNHDGYLNRYLAGGQARVIGIGRDVEGVHRDGTRVPLHLAVSEFEVEGERFFLGTLRDMTVEKAYERRLHYQATHDSLTGLMNRQTMEQLIRETQAAVRKREPGDSTYWLAWVDLDGFKALNDSYGHHAGDVFLKALTRKMAGELQESDHLARMGGDEFGVLVDATTAEAACEQIESICAGIRNFILPWYDRPLRVGVSAGITPLLGEAELTDLLILADKACYEAKRHGRNQVRVASDADRMLQQTISRTDWASRIAGAIERDEFELFLMGVHDQAGHCNGAEVLIRLPDGDSLVMPADIIGVAEAYGLVPAMDEWVLNKTLSRLSERDSGLPEDFVISVNCSTLTLSQPNFMARFRELIDKHAVPPQRLAIEVTETSTLSDRHNIFRTLGLIRELGCRVVLDDFGEGTSSLKVLEDLPVETLKIDGTLIRDLDANAMHSCIVGAIAGVAACANIAVVAEHVEGLGLVPALEKLGVTGFQGFAFSQPMPWDDFVRQDLAEPTAQP